ncbi:hypothetical protein Tco_0229623, partial [Tanacetum coccineum]
MSFDPRLFAYVESPICIRNPWSLLIPLSRGSFDVIVGMDWVSKRKFVIVCHEKVVRIPLEGDEILRVHGERTQGVMNTLMNRKVEKLKAARDRQKNYVDNRRKPLEFEVGDRVMLKVSPWKGVIRFGKN